MVGGVGLVTRQSKRGHPDMTRLGRDTDYLPTQHFTYLISLVT